MTWKNEKQRHSMSSRGISTKQNKYKTRDDAIDDIFQKLANFNEHHGINGYSIDGSVDDINITEDGKTSYYFWTHDSYNIYYKNTKFTEKEIEYITNLFNELNKYN